MSADDIVPGEDKQLYRRGLGFLERGRHLRGLSEVAFQRIERRLERPAPARPRRRFLLATATVVVALLVGSAFAVARVGWRGLPFVGRLFGERVVAPLPVPRPATRRPPAPASQVKADLPAPAAAPPLPEPSASPASSAPVPGAVPVASAIEPAAQVERKAVPAQRKLAARAVEAVPVGTSPAPAAAENPILAESQSFAAALARWHRERDGRAALAALDAHDQRFPAGHLGPESRLLRAEILLAQGYESEGLALLDRLSLGGSPRARELYTVRGELRIKHGRCREGKADLDEVLAKGVADGFGRRAVEALHHCP